MFEMVDVAERSTIVFALMIYKTALQTQNKPLVDIGGVKVPLREEKARAEGMIEVYKNQFIYRSDEVLDRAKMYKQGVERQPAFIALLAELQQLVNRAQIFENYIDDVTLPDYAQLDIDSTARMREIVNVLNAGGMELTDSRTLASDIAEDRH